MNETTMQIEVDSASTAQEVVQQISRAVGIVDPFGFAVFVKLFDKVSVNTIMLRDFQNR